MTIDPTRIARRIAADLVDIAGAMPRWQAEVRLQARDGYPASTGGGGGSKGEISDPTSAAALANTSGTRSGYQPSDEHQVVVETLRSIEAQCEVLRRLVGRRNIVRDVEVLTCSGGHLPGAHIPLSDGGWHDPTCTVPAEMRRLADGSYVVARDGLCSTHARYYRRWRAGESHNPNAA
jgi:hypothetical protein